MLTKELVAVIVVCATAFFADQLLLPVLPLYMRTEVGLTDQTIGLMFSVMMVGIAISEIFWGWAVDRVNVKIAIFMGTLACGAVISTFHLVGTAGFFAIAIFWYGFSRSPVFILGRYYVAISTPVRMMASGMAFLSMTISLTQALGGIASGFVAEEWGYTATLWLAATIAASAGVLLMLVGRGLDFDRHKQDHEYQEARANHNSVSKATKALTITVGLFGTIFFISFGIFMAYTPLFGVDVLGIGARSIGALFSIRGFVSTILLIPAGKLADTFGKSRFLLLGLACVTASMGGMALSRDYQTFFFSTIVFSIGFSLYMPAAISLLQERVPVSWAGTATGIYGFMEDVGWIIGPAVAGLLWETWSKRGPFFFAAVVSVVGLVILFTTRGRLIPSGKGTAKRYVEVGEPAATMAASEVRTGIDSEPELGEPAV